MDAAIPAVRRELDAFLSTGTPLPDTNDVAGYDQEGEGEWTTLVLHWFGRRVEANCRQFPETLAALAKVPALQSAGFTVLGPHSHLPRHTGPNHALRYLVGVIVPGPAGSCRMAVGDVTTVWEEGRGVLFDDASPHEAWNDAAARRYLLFVQCRLPVPGWRGAIHRGTQRAFGLATSGLARRADRLTRQLSSTPAAR